MSKIDRASEPTVHPAEEPCPAAPTYHYEDERLKRPPPREVLLTPEVRALLGKPHLLPGEDPAAYDRLLEETAHARQPKDITEWLLIQDYVETVWRSNRLRGFHAQVLADALRVEVQYRFTALLKSPKERPEKTKERAASAAAALMRGDPKLLKDFAAQLDLPRLQLYAYKAVQETLEAFDGMLATLIARRLRIAQALETRRLAIARIWRLEHIIPARAVTL